MRYLAVLAATNDVAPGALYRLPIGARDASVAGVSGVPYDHLSMDERDGEFRALVDWRTIRCDGAYRAPAENAFLKIRTSAFGTVFGMFHLNRLPRHHHPVFESDRFAAATDDKYFISIEAEDAKFDVEKTKGFLESVHPSHVEVVEEVVS